MQVVDDNRFSIRIDQGFTDGSTYYKFLISFPQVYVKPLGPNDPKAITATLDAPPSSGFSTGSCTLGNVAVRGTVATVDAPVSSGVSQTYIVPVIGENGGQVASIIIKETAPGSLLPNDGTQGNNGTVKLTLPLGFTWTDVEVISDWGFNKDNVDHQIVADASGRSSISLIIKKATTDMVGRIIVKGSVSVDTDVAQPGDILVSYEGTNPGVEPATLTVATYATSGVSASQETTTSVVAGRNNQEIGQIAVHEQTPGDFAEGRTITLTLPSYAKWRTYPQEVKKQAGDGKLTFLDLNSDRTVLRYKVTKASTVRTDYLFENCSVDLALNSADTLNVQLGGSCGVTGAVDVAAVMQPLSVTVNKETVRAGVKGQSIGEITLVEQSGGALRARDPDGKQAYLRLALPAGVTFSKTPAVTVSSGNIHIPASQIGLDSTNRVLTIPIEQSSTDPSTIVISGIELDVDRTVPEGDIKLEIGGTAITENSTTFADNLNKIEVAIASCATPASSDAVRTAVFTVGEASYQVNDQTVEMDTAPYIKDGRVMIPLRFAANALGVTDDNIIWDDSTKTVTLLKGNRVVQLQIGKNALTINGVSIAIDVAPEIKDGRTMLPIRAVSTALGATVEWNEEDRTVTLEMR
ncbi:MAG: copper amine oxidase N-terminal domain-containing protein [Thermacetogeniaceae bacterium]